MRPKSINTTFAPGTDSQDLASFAAWLKRLATLGYVVRLVPTADETP